MAWSHFTRCVSPALRHSKYRYTAQQSEIIAILRAKQDAGASLEDRLASYSSQLVQAQRYAEQRDDWYISTFYYVEGLQPGVASLSIVPGSHRVRNQALKEGLDEIFIAAGADWREPGCSMCLAMNPDKLAPRERAASTSNRNFEGRQGPGGRTHLVSPAVAAATAVKGTFCTPADLEGSQS